MRLIKIPRSGAVEAELLKCARVKKIIESTRKMYSRNGYKEPWVGYLAFMGHNYIGTCAFKSCPQKGRVEIAYFTFPEYQGRGFGGKMVQALVEIARGEDSHLVITAQTSPEISPSNSVLKKTGFQFAETIEHAESGEIWEWQLKPLDPQVFN